MSTLRADTIQSTGGGAATLTNQSAAKSWVNFNGNGTIAARNSLNLSSLTDNATGKYTVSFTSSMTGDNYSVSGHSASDGSTWDFWMGSSNGYPTSSNVGVESGYGASTYNDATYVFCTINGDLA